MKKQHLSNKDIKKLNQELYDLYGLEQFIDKKAKVERAQSDESSLIIIDDLPTFFSLDGQLIPTLQLLVTNNILKTVTVDMPAVKFMINGADVMRPGIVAMDDFAKEEIVVVVDENNKKPLCVCRASFSSEKIRSMDKGKVLKNLHYIGDKLWNSGK